MKKTKLLVLFLIVVMCMSIFVACEKDKTTQDDKSYTVTYYDGDEVLKTETVKANEKAVDWTPVKDGYTFVGWYGTKSLNHKFDFNTAITADTSIFANMAASTQSVDTRAWAILGSGRGSVLTSSDWGKVINDDHLLVKTADKNEFKITIDLYENDEFQFAINTSWQNKRGYGYLTTTTDADELVCFSGTGGIGETLSKGLNIKVAESGNYTFTLLTYPDDDYYDVDNNRYTEAEKEVYNMSNVDNISWVRNGDAAVIAETRLDYFIKGANITKWVNICNTATQMTLSENTYELEVYLEANDQFMFASQNTNIITEDVSSSGAIIGYSNLNDESKALFDMGGNNMVVKTSGNYKFTFADEVLSVELLNETAPAECDYYLDGNFGGQNWNASYFDTAFKFVKNGNVYELNNVELGQDEVFIIQSFVAGATAEDTDVKLAAYNQKFFNGTDDLVTPENPAGKNFNFKVNADGVYNITFNPYAKIIEVTEVGGDILVHAKGTFNGWAVNDESKFSKNADGEYELVLTLESNDAFGLMLGGANGTFVNASALGDAENNVNATFGSAGNFTCSEAGTYKIVYNSETQKVNIFLAE